MGFPGRTNVRGTPRSCRWVLTPNLSVSISSSKHPPDKEGWWGNEAAIHPTFWALPYSTRPISVLAQAVSPLDGKTSHQDNQALP